MITVNCILGISPGGPVDGVRCAAFDANEPQAESLSLAMVDHLVCLPLRFANESRTGWDRRASLAREYLPLDRDDAAVWRRCRLFPDRDIGSRLPFVLLGLFHGELAGLVFQHDRDIIAHGISQLTGATDKFGPARSIDQGSLADRANDDIEEFFVQCGFLASRGWKIVVIRWGRVMVNGVASPGEACARTDKA